MVPVRPASGRPDETYAAAPEGGQYAKNVLVLRGYRLTTGYVGFFPAVRHPIGGERSLQLSGTRWSFTPEGFRRPWPGGVAGPGSSTSRDRKRPVACSSPATGRGTCRPPSTSMRRPSSPSRSATTRAGR